MIWHPVFVDPRAQGEKARYMASAIRMLSQAILDNPDFITIDEGRAIVGLPPRDPAEKPQEPVSPDMATIPVEPARYPPLEIMTAEDLRVAVQIRELADKERELGKVIIKEQEE